MNIVKRDLLNQVHARACDSSMHENGLTAEFFENENFICKKLFLWNGDILHSDMWALLFYSECEKKTHA